MKERNAWMILGIILIAFGLFVLSTTTENVKIELKPLSMALLFLLFSGIMLVAIGSVGILLDRLT